MEIKDALNTYAVIPSKPADKKQRRRKGGQQQKESEKQSPESAEASHSNTSREDEIPHLDEYA